MNNKNTSTKILIILLILLCAVVIALGVLYLGVRQKVVSADERIEEYNFPLEQFVVNLKSEDIEQNYLKTTFVLMYTDKKDEEILKTNVGKIRNIINNKLRVKTAEEILDVEKMEKFKEDLKKSLNEPLDKDIIKDIYITDIVVQ